MPLPEELAIDANHPAVREYLTLVRLQVLTPLSVLINIATVTVTTFLISPGIGSISKIHPTPISPSPNLLGIYFLVLFATEIGYCILLVMASKDETKNTIINGVGYFLIVANWLMAGWAVAWALQFFTLSVVLLSLLTAVLLYSNVALLLFYPPTRTRPVDTALIHGPVRLFFILPATVLLPQAIFIMLGKTWDPKHPDDGRYANYQWEGFAVVCVTNIVGFLIIVLRRDIAWCLGQVWLNICILVERPKSAPVEGAAIAFVIIQPVALIVAASFRAFYYRRHREGAIALPSEEEEDQERNEEHGRNVGRVWG
ncbi:hypothetical protein BU17DRAFT_53179 [Hysterangium stoloniferum]|nr:hypothetical protein BU17DRAFT_53179 [Hysterangium stoloniferum]